MNAESERCHTQQLLIGSTIYTCSRVSKRSLGEQPRSPGQSARSERRLSLRRRHELVGVHHVAAADFEAVKHGETVEGVLETGGTEFELARPVADEGAWGGVRGGRGVDVSEQRGQKARRGYAGVCACVGWEGLPLIHAGIGAEGLRGRDVTWLRSEVKPQRVASSYLLDVVRKGDRGCRGWEGRGRGGLRPCELLDSSFGHRGCGSDAKHGNKENRETHCSCCCVGL
jgi:hypothetical protein